VTQRPTASTGVGRPLHGIANTTAVITPDRVVVGGGIAAYSTCSCRPSRTSPTAGPTTSLDEVEMRSAELGTWAGCHRGGGSGRAEAAEGSRVSSADASPAAGWRSASERSRRAAIEGRLILDDRASSAAA
jgi:predicted NBD/HSP70 family sugar kinase